MTRDPMAPGLQNLSQHDLSHLSGLIEAAKAEADRLGPTLAAAASFLGQALSEIGRSAVQGGRPDEGTPLQDLTTENDR